MKTLKQIMADLPATERRAVQARTAELLAEEMTLAQLRRAMDATQSTVARRLRIRQDGVSRIEARGDVRLSTIREYVAALGGTVELVARLPGRAPIQLTLAEGHTAKRRTTQKAK